MENYSYYHEASMHPVILSSFVKKADANDDEHDYL